MYNIFIFSLRCSKKSVALSTATHHANLPELGENKSNNTSLCSPFSEKVEYSEEWNTGGAEKK